MQAKTRSAPRMPSPWRRSIQSPTRSGSSRRTSPQSPTGASSGRGRQTRWTLVARAADPCARSRLPVSVAIGQEPVMVQPAADHPGKQSLPAFGCLVSKDDGADAIFVQNSSTLGEGLGHRLFEESAVLRATIVRLVSSCTASRLFRRQWIAGIEWIRSKRIPGQRSLQPDEEEVREVGVRDGVVVWWISEPDGCRLVGQG